MKHYLKIHINVQSQINTLAGKDTVPYRQKCVNFSRNYIQSVKILVAQEIFSHFFPTKIPRLKILVLTLIGPTMDPFDYISIDYSPISEL